MKKNVFYGQCLGCWLLSLSVNILAFLKLKIRKYRKFTASLDPCQSIPIDPDHGLQDPGHDLRDPGHGLRDPDHCLQDPGHGVQAVLDALRSLFIDGVMYSMVLQSKVGELN